MIALVSLLFVESITLAGPARRFEYMEASGRRAAFLGREDGSFEAWVYPLKVFHGFELLFELADYGEPIPAAKLATSVEIRPESSTVRYSHASFTSDATWFVPIDEAGGLVLVDVEASDAVGLRVRFQTDLQLMWPAALGGQYSYWDEELSAYGSRAFAYCLSTDEDGDGLMDNTLAGLGAVETGSLRSEDVLTDVYLAAVWTEAVRSMRELANELGERSPPQIPDAISRRFQVDDGIAFALLRSGARQEETTVWPAFGLWRGLLSSDAALDALASSRLGTDWGVRMLSRDSAFYDHGSYNNGAVWPFLTGIAALALYAHDRPHAAWSYLEGTKELTFLGARGYVPELLSGDRLAPVDAAVPHQLFATSGLVSPLLRGLVGHHPGHHPGRLVPKPPPSWDRFRVENLRHARGVFDFEWQRFRGDSEDRIAMRLDGTIGPLIVELSLPGGPVTWSPEPGTGVRTHEVRFRPGIEIEPLHTPLRAGDRSRRLRILKEELLDDTYTARLEGRRRTSYQLRARIPFDVESIENGTRRGDRIDVAFPDGAGDWTTVDLVVKLRR